MLEKIRQSRLAKEIAVVLAVKGLLLFALWYAFFSQPLDKSLTADQVSGAMTAEKAR